MVSWINPKIIIKDVGEKGVGSFAVAPITKDEVVVVQGGRIMEWKRVEASDYKPFGDHCFQIENDLLICPIEPKKEKLDGICKVNHSCNPTCGIRGQVAVLAMRDILDGDEITYDYAMTDANWGSVICTEMKCFCGAKDCRKMITGEDWKRQELQVKYKGYFSTFIQEMIDQGH